MSTDPPSRRRVPEPPRGRARLLWLGPAFLWMLSAAGSGELLFTPRIASLYGYALLWALLAAVVLKWFVNREIGRYTACAGETVMAGFARVPGPRHWAVWAILLPQIVVAVATVAGLAGAAATAAILVLPGPALVWVCVVIAISATVIFFGQYGRIERLTAVLAVALTAAVLSAALSVFPEPADLAAGLVPQLPENVAIGEVLPWLGFMLAGAAGLMFFSYWVDARGYGLAGDDVVKSDNAQEDERDREERLRGWIGMVTVSNTLAVTGALLIAMAFLILGGELLRPAGLVPEEQQTAEVLGRLLGDVWGPFGFWFMIGAVFVTFTSTILSTQDGFARLFADGTRLIARGFGAAEGRWTDLGLLRRGYVVGVLALAPGLAYAAFGEPVGLLQVAGAIEAAHIPVVTGLILYLNRTRLPAALRPSVIALVGTGLAGLFFGLFALLYLAQLAGLLGGTGSS